jgi:hypothetical protein
VSIEKKGESRVIEDSPREAFESKETNEEPQVQPETNTNSISPVVKKKKKKKKKRKETETVGAANNNNTNNNDNNAKKRRLDEPELAVDANQATAKKAKMANR